MKLWWRRCAACFTLGALISAVAMTLFLGEQIDRLLYVNRMQQDKLTEVTSELDELKASMQSRQRQCVRALDVKINLEGDLAKVEEQAARVGLEKEVKQRLQPILGRELSELNYWLIPGVVNDRTAQVDSKQFELSVQTVIVAETLGVELKASLKEHSIAPF